MLRTAAPLASVFAALAAAAPALAQDPAPVPEPAPAPAPTPPPPAPAPVAGTLSIGLEKVNGRSTAVLAGSTFRIRGVVKPYVAGQKVTVRFYRGTRKLAAKAMTVKPVGARGGFVLSFKARSAGRITVRASHRATPELATLVARARGLDVLPLRASAGSTGLAVRVLQARLAKLGYVVGRRGAYDARTARAVLAFRKVTAMARTQVASREVFRALARGRGAYRLRFPGHGRHVEADLSRQVLVLANGGRVERIYPTSSGAPGTPTVLGSFRVYRKSPGTNAKGMVFSSYFIRGYAIHGYASVPVFSASHGCLRVPVADAVPIYSWIRHGDRVDVYP